MPPSGQRRKEIERRFLEDARRASSIFPPGDIELFEEPDLKITMGAESLGVEVTELVRPKGGNAFLPVEAENFHIEVVRLAEECHRTSGASPVDVVVHFLDDRRCPRDKQKMARGLAEFVKSRYLPGSGTVEFKNRLELPAGFEVILISSPTQAWESAEVAVASGLKCEQLASTIRRKNNLLPKYRAAMPNSQIWLLVASDFSVPRSVPIPRSISEWKFSFDFDKVLLFSCVDQQVIEIARL